MLIDDCLQTKTVKINNDLNRLLKSLFVCFSVPTGSNIIVGTLYKPPYSDLTKIDLELETLVASLSNQRKAYNICGDFNLNLLNIDMP